MNPADCVCKQPLDLLRSFADVNAKAMGPSSQPGQRGGVVNSQQLQFGFYTPTVFFKGKGYFEAKHKY